MTCKLAFKDMCSQAKYKFINRDHRDVLLNSMQADVAPEQGRPYQLMSLPNKGFEALARKVPVTESNPMYARPHGFGVS